MAVAIGLAIATPDVAIAVAIGRDAANPFSPITARPIILKSSLVVLTLKLILLDVLHLKLRIKTSN